MKCGLEDGRYPARGLELRLGRSLAPSVRDNVDVGLLP